MIFYIKDENNKLYATCKFNKETKSLLLEKGSFIKKSFDCPGCKEILKQRLELLEEGKLEDHNDEVYLLQDPIEFEDVNDAACLVLGGKMRDAEKLIQNEFGESIQNVYTEVFR